MTLALWVYGVGVVVSAFGGAWLLGRIGESEERVPAVFAVALCWPVSVPLGVLIFGVIGLYDLGDRQRIIRQNNK